MADDLVPKFCTEPCPASPVVILSSFSTFTVALNVLAPSCDHLDAPVTSPAAMQDDAASTLSDVGQIDDSDDNAAADLDILPLVKDLEKKKTCRSPPQGQPEISHTPHSPS